VCYLTYQERLAQQGRLPVAVYLHAYCDQRGLAWERHEGAGVSPGERLALHGFLAVQFDQFGSGRRNHEATLSYFVEHPDRSALGVMIQDVRRIMDSLPAVPFAHAQRVALVGYSLGGAVALHTAALDERVGAVASVCGVGSLRRDVHGDQTEGLARWCVQRPTLPRLGYFIGDESRIPYDFHDVLALIAPRLVLIVAPRLDQDWLPDDVRTCVDAARRVYRLLGAARNIELLTPDDFNRFPPQIQNVVADWLCEKAH
jgi:pimeloyl-ACP methyl ester carboxylesterase